MTLSPYHARYAALSEENIASRVREKAIELDTIFTHFPISPQQNTVTIAVLGCADKRLVSAHKKLFNQYLQNVTITTFDITIEHLEGAEHIVQHDCTLELPGGLYDIVYSHVLLPFIPTEKQYALLYNSYTALSPGGIAIHILDRDNYAPQHPHTRNVVAKDELSRKLSEDGISLREIPIKYGIALILSKPL